MRKILLLSCFAFAFAGIGRAQIVEITANAGTSATGPFGTSNYAAGEYIYTEAELGGASNFVTAGTAITHIAFSINTVGTNTTFNNVNVYMKNVSAATTSFTTGTYTTAGYTLVYSGSVSGAATGFTEIALTTPFTRTAGNNLQMLIERTDNVAHASYIYNCSVGNNVSSSTNSCRRYNNTVALSGSTSLTVSTFRAAMRFAHRYNSDSRVVNVYTLGKIPTPNGVPHTVSALISNDGLTPFTNLNVTLTVTGANAYSNTKVISSLASLATSTVTFDPYTPSVEGSNTVTVTVASDDYAANNSSSVTQVINKNTWSYAYGTTAAGGVGFNGASGDFVAKFNTNIATAISQVAVNFSAGGQPYQIGIWQANGAGGTPGTNLFTSATLTSVSGVNTIPVSPAVNLSAGDFYVGVKQTGTTNVSFSYQTESPIRASTFYFTSPSGGTTWTDFAPNNPFRFMIEPKLILPVDAGVSALSSPSAITCFSSPQTRTATVVNSGANAIAAGAASVTLKISGANTYTSTLTNTGSIASGASEVITFTGINLPNGGTNFDTLFVNLSGDPEKSNDTIKSSFLTAATIGTLPLDEGFENATINVGYITLVAGARNLVTLNTGTYTNVDIGGNLNPHGGTKMIIFDNYSGTTSSGVVNRLFSDCINVPASGAGLCNYNLSFWMSHDVSFSTLLDSLYISVSTNGTTWTRLSPGYARYDAAFTTPGWRKETVSLAAYAGQKIQIGFEDVSKYGNVIGLDDVNVGSTAAQNITLSTASNNGIDLQKGCDDQGWTYYVNPASPNEYLFGIQWDPGNTGANATAKGASIPRIQLDAANYAAEDIPNKRATYTMRRYWNVNLNSTTMTAPVNVRFFYNAAEKTATDNNAAAFALANGAAVEPPQWFKTTGGLTFTPGPASVTPIGVNDADSLVNVNTTNATINGVLYAQFNGVTTFSGGTYASGVGTGRVLPIRLLSFTGMLNRNNAVDLEWQVALQMTGTTYIVERSFDGVTFEQIGSVPANNSNTFTYKFTDAFPGSVNFYRLKIAEGGRDMYSRIIRINKDGGGITLYPVPAKDEVNLYIQKQALLNTNAQVTTADGKTIMQIKILRLHEVVDISRLQNGIYFLRFADGSQVKMVKQ